MTSDKVARLLDLLNDLVNEPGTWREKKAALESQASDDDKTNLAEFAAWWSE